MSNAWEVTQDDILAVLNKHNRNTGDTLDVAESIICEEGARIEKAALKYNEIDDQQASALDEIEDILIENDILTPPKLFSLT